MSEWQSLGGTSTTTPAIVSWGENDKYLFVFAVGTDQALWYRRNNGIDWSGWESLGGVVMSAPHAVKSGESSVDVFAVGVHSELLHWQFENNAWTRWPLVNENQVEVFKASPHAGDVGLYRYWESLGGICMSPPHSVMFGELNDTLSVFVLGTDRAVWFRGRVNGSWRDWDTLGRVFSSPPHAVTFQRETLAVFALGTDSAVWCWMNSGWTSLGGTFTSPPHAISTPEHIHAFASDTNSELKHRLWDGSHWGDWESLGGILMSPPHAVSGSVRSIVEPLRVYTVGTDSAVWVFDGENGQWGNWQSLGGVFQSSPQIAFSEASDLFFAVGLQSDHAVWYIVKG